MPLSVHPRTRVRALECGLGSELVAVTVLEPRGYDEMLLLTEGATVRVTSSGGLREETTALRAPCVAPRERAERSVTLDHGNDLLAPCPLSLDGILAELGEARARGVMTRERRDPKDGMGGRQRVRRPHERESLVPSDHDARAGRRPTASEWAR